MLLDSLNRKLLTAKSSLEIEKNKREERINSLAGDAAKAGKIDSEKLNEAKKFYAEPELFDADKGIDQIATLIISIRDFEDEVDAVLSESNAVTQIEVTLK